MKKIFGVLLILVIIVSIFTGCGSSPGAITSETPTSSDNIEMPATENHLAKDDNYTSKEDVGLYIHLYGNLPPNFITKKQAQSLGWSGGALEQYSLALNL